MGDSSDRCALVSEGMGELPCATAPTARAWLLLEHPGPWGPRPPRDCGFDQEALEHLERELARLDVRLQLIRPHSRSRTPAPGPRRYFLAHTSPRGSWVVPGQVDGDDDLLSLPLEDACSPDPPSGMATRDDPLILTCTHGRRDACCAVFGRSVAQALEDRFGDWVWETTHTGGHRFAANVVLFPSGIVLGRLRPEVAPGVVADALDGTLRLEHFRGRTADDAWEQAAEWWARRELGLTDAARLDVQVTEASGAAAVAVLASQDHRYELRLERRSSGVVRPISCGKLPGEDVGEIVLSAAVRSGPQVSIEPA